MDIVLATANAKFHHASLALRTLYANLHGLPAKLLEFVITDSAVHIVERILLERPKILGLSVYIWNITLLSEVVDCLKRIQPELIVVLGGPEVSHSLAGLKIAEQADYIIQGEGEVAFYQLCRALLTGERPSSRCIAGGLPDLNTINLPYHYYTDTDLAHRTVYVEASRGCPYSCEFCLSALDTQVRHFPLPSLFEAFQQLLDRGCRHFKFIDRTFNLKLETSAQILEFFLERYTEGLFLHFEMVPDRFPEGLRAIVARFPLGALQFEVGVQSLNEAVGRRISRRQNIVKMEDNFKFLQQAGVHLHADLIIGLPGESFDDFGRGLDRLFAMGPQEIQVGILKLLHGAPIARHIEPFKLVFSSMPPYEILQSSTIDFATMQKAKRFAFLWDRLVNRGNLSHTLKLLLQHGGPFSLVLAFSEFVYQQEGQVYAIALDRLAECLKNFLLEQGQAEDKIAAALEADYEATGRRIPNRLKNQPVAKEKYRSRQLRHQSILAEQPTSE